MNAQRPKRRMNTHSALLNKYYQPKAGMNAQQRQKRDHIFQDAALLNKYLDGAALTDEEIVPGVVKPIPPPVGSVFPDSERAS